MEKLNKLKLNVLSEQILEQKGMNCLRGSVVNEAEHWTNAYDMYKKVIYYMLSVFLLSCNQKGAGNVYSQAVDNDSITVPQIPEGAAPMYVSNNNSVYIQATVNDSITIFSLFDTGWGGFCLTMPILERYNLPFKKLRQNSDAVAVNLSSVRIGDKFLEYKGYDVDRFKEPIFAPDYNNDKRIWELNFENNYVKIWDNDTVPQYSILFPYTLYQKHTNALLVNLPMYLVGSRRDTLFVDYHYIFDTGTSLSACLFSREGNIITEFAKKQPHYYAVGKREEESDFVVDEIIINDSVKVDHGYFGYWRNAPFHIFPENVMGTLGVDFLKHFNVFIDLKKQVIYLQKHSKAFEEQHFSNLGGFMYRIDGVLRIVQIGANSPMSGLGIEKKSEILEINGIQANDIDSAMIQKLYATPANTPVKMLIMQDSIQRTIEFNAYDNPLNYYNKKSK
jgi:hypothetical protein